MDLYKKHVLNHPQTQPFAVVLGPTLLPWALDLFEFQLNRQLGGSMPNCADPPTGHSSRRSSRCTPSHQVTTSGAFGSVPNSRRSSAGSRPGSRRESFLINQQDSLDSNSGYISASSLAASAALPPSADQHPESMTAGQSLLQSIGAGVVGAASSFSTVTPPRYRKSSFLRPYQHF